MAIPYTAQIKNPDFFNTNHYDTEGIVMIPDKKLLLPESQKALDGGLKIY